MLLLCYTPGVNSLMSLVCMLLISSTICNEISCSFTAEHEPFSHSRYSLLLPYSGRII
ncbi:hypothetical protein GcM1_c15096o4 [Golovinomyces cichoracearum]|uniref:Uncharacterized protein n=1 Tax=Golovinomyces cichoracearum TaxID=62708 RepID=A0A420IM68_9PEZI|nr:hypothetical protein GcM1_c15096o4 [Golovinomyces cichoracearum]